MLFLQILDAKSKVTDGRSWQLKLEISQGKQEQIYDIQVLQSLHRDYKLVKAEKIDA